MTLPTPVHGWTAHGWPCCPKAPIDQKPATTSCPGPSCAPCRLEIQTLHTALREAHLEVNPK